MKTQEIVDLLNHAWANDPDAIMELMESEVKVNDDLADHPVIQVRQPDPEDPQCFLTPLGLLNGIALASDGKNIIAHFDSDEFGNVTELLGFTCNPKGAIPTEEAMEEDIAESVCRAFKRYGRPVDNRRDR